MILATIVIYLTHGEKYLFKLFPLLDKLKIIFNRTITFNHIIKNSILNIYQFLEPYGHNVNIKFYKLIKNHVSFKKI